LNDKLRREVRRRLLDSGLLQLVLEQDPSARLPSLGRSSQSLLFRSSAYDGSLQGRLETFVRNYTACCRDAGIPCKQDRLTGQAVMLGVILAAVAVTMPVAAGTGHPLFVHAVVLPLAGLWPQLEAAWQLRGKYQTYSLLACLVWPELAEQFHPSDTGSEGEPASSLEVSLHDQPLGDTAPTDRLAAE
jgi:hypothetical protein